MSFISKSLTLLLTTTVLNSAYSSTYNNIIPQEQYTFSIGNTNSINNGITKYIYTKENGAKNNDKINQPQNNNGIQISNNKNINNANGNNNINIKNYNQNNGNKIDLINLNSNGKKTTNGAINNNKFKRYNKSLPIHYIQPNNTIDVNYSKSRIKSLDDYQVSLLENAYKCLQKKNQQGAMDCFKEFVSYSEQFVDGIYISKENIITLLENTLECFSESQKNAFKKAKTKMIRELVSGNNNKNSNATVNVKKQRRKIIQQVINNITNKLGNKNRNQNNNVTIKLTKSAEKNTNKLSKKLLRTNFNININNNNTKKNRKELQDECSNIIKLINITKNNNTISDYSKKEIMNIKISDSLNSFKGKEKHSTSEEKMNAPIVEEKQNSNKYMKQILNSKINAFNNKMKQQVINQNDFINELSSKAETIKKLLKNCTEDDYEFSLDTQDKNGNKKYSIQHLIESLHIVQNKYVGFSAIKQTSDDKDEKTLIGGITELQNYELISKIISATITDDKKDIKNEYKNAVYFIIERYLVAPCIDKFFSGENKYYVTFSDHTDYYNLSVMNTIGYINNIILYIIVDNKNNKNNKVRVKLSTMFGKTKEGYEDYIKSYNDNRQENENIKSYFNDINQQQNKKLTNKKNKK